MALSQNFTRPVIGGSILILFAVASSGESITAKSLKGQLGRKSVPFIVDVRSRSEYLNGHIPGALHIPFWAMLWRHKQIRVKLSFIANMAPERCSPEHCCRWWVKVMLLCLRGTWRVGGELVCPCAPGHKSPAWNGYWTTAFWAFLLRHFWRQLCCL